MAGFRIDRYAARACVRDRAHLLQAIQVKDKHLLPARNVEAAIVVIRMDVIETACSHQLLRLDNTVRFFLSGKAVAKQENGGEREVCGDEAMEKVR